MAHQTLNDPAWPGMLPSCPGCGYSLNGLSPPTSCPECGFELDDRTLILHGVLKSDASGSTLRRWLWVAVIASGVLLSFGWFALVLLQWVGCMLFLAWLGALIAMLVTSKRDRAGRMPIVFCASGFIALPSLTNPGNEGQAVAWDRVAGLRLDRVSSVWYRLRVWGRGNDKLLDAGVRCPDAHAKPVYDTLNQFQTGQPDDPPTTQHSEHEA